MEDFKSARTEITKNAVLKEMQYRRELEKMDKSEALRHEHVSVVRQKFEPVGNNRAQRRINASNSRRNRRMMARRNFALATEFAKMLPKTLTFTG